MSFSSSPGNSTAKAIAVDATRPLDRASQDHCSRSGRYVALDLLCRLSGRVSGNRIRRGFMSSGISFVRSTISRPLSSFALSTLTWSASSKRRTKGLSSRPRCSTSSFEQQKYEGRQAI